VKFSRCFGRFLEGNRLATLLPWANSGCLRRQRVVIGRLSGWQQASLTCECLVTWGVLKQASTRNKC